MSAMGPSAEAGAGAKRVLLEKHHAANLYIEVVGQRVSVTLNDSSQTAMLRGKNLFIKINQLQNGVKLFPAACAS